MNRHNEILVEEKMRLLDESLMLIERLKKMRAVGASPRFVGIDPHILKVSGLDFIGAQKRISR
ncbi:MAG: hypothetical protein V2A72_04740 [Candidatus Omnitrophota bacterium]